MKLRITVLCLAVSIGGCSRQESPSEQAVVPAEAAPEAKAARPAARPPRADTRSEAYTETATKAAVRTSPTLPEGTVLKVRTTTALSTASAKAGDAFTAHVTEPVLLGGREIVPKGATVQGEVVEADKGGRVDGRARIAVRLTTLNLENGGSVALQTSSVARDARGTKKKDATKIGIGAGIGAAIGAIAGGGKGAAIGAGVGGGAGTGAVLATRGDAAVIPSESLLSFELNAPARLR